MTMIRNCIAALSLVLAATAAVTPVQAQQHQTDSAAARRAELGRELVGLSVGSNFIKAFERVMTEQVDAAAGKQGEEAAWMRATMPQMMTRLLTRIMDEMGPVYATVFTEQELQAQIDFYRTPVGRAIADKTIALGLAVQEIEAEVLEDFTTEFESKYCARFSCDNADETAAKPQRR